MQEEYQTNKPLRQVIRTQNSILKSVIEVKEQISNISQELLLLKSEMYDVKPKTENHTVTKYKSVVPHLLHIIKYIETALRYIGAALNKENLDHQEQGNREHLSKTHPFTRTQGMLEDKDIGKTIMTYLIKIEKGRKLYCLILIK